VNAEVENLERCVQKIEILFAYNHAICRNIRRRLVEDINWSEIVQVYGNLPVQ